MIIFVLVFQACSPLFLYTQAADSKDQNPVCSGPSETMSMYYAFQREMMAAIWWADISEKRFAVSMDEDGLFSQWVLDLPDWFWDIGDLAASSAWWNIGSLVSAWATTTVLLLLSTVAIVQWAGDWFAILFRDRPIVRDYKTALDIENELFDLAYEMSQKVFITASLEWNLSNNIKAVIEDYQKKWLLSWDSFSIDSSVSISHVIWDLVWMNASIKHFITYWKVTWTGWLRTFHWCLNGTKKGECGSKLEFSEEAINKLGEEYSWLWTFWSCNLLWSSLEDSLSRWLDPSWVETAIDNLKESLNRLMRPFENIWSLASYCDKLSEYEMAQLRAYYWGNWTCWDKNWLGAINLAKGIKSSIQDNQQNSKESLSQIKEEKAKKRTEKKARRQEVRDLKKSLRDQKKALKETIPDMTALSSSSWRENYGVSDYKAWDWYTQDLNEEISSIFMDVIRDYEEARYGISSSDLSYELVEIQALLSQIKSVQDLMWKSKSEQDSLYYWLDQVEKYQCQN